MKSKDIAQTYKIDHGNFDDWLLSSKVKHKRGLMGGIDVEDGQNIGELVASFKQYQEKKREEAELQRAKELHDATMKAAEEKAAAERNQLAAEHKQAALANMLITSGFNFDGYTITKYSGYISGDDAVQANRPTQGWAGKLSGNVGEELLAGLAHIRRNALAELKEAAFALGCNAVIGVDFDYLTLDPETVTPQGGTLYLPFLFAVTANGNAVVIEKSGRPTQG